MSTAFQARRFVAFCFLSLIASLPIGAQTISRLTDQVFKTHRSSSPDYFVNLNPGKVLFMAILPGSGNKAPYATDGTTAGTVPLLPLLAADTTTVGGYHLLGSHAYFFTNTSGSSSGSFWKTDGTPGGTTLVTNQAPTSVDSVQVVNGRIVGIGYESPGNVLWVSNGAPQGTGTIFVPPASTSIDSGNAAAGSYFFSLAVSTGEGRRDAIWKTDGTTTGTVAVKTLSHEVGGTTVYDQSPGYPTAFNGSVYFLAKESVYDPFYGDYYDRSVLWKTDGTAAGTQRLGNLTVLYNRMSAFSGSLIMERSGSVDWAGAVTRPQILRSDGTIAGSSVVFSGSTPRPYTGMSRIGESGGYVYYNMVQSNIMYPTSPKYSDLHRMRSDGSFEAIGTLPTSWHFNTGDRLSYAYAMASQPSGIYLGIYSGVDDVWRISNASPPIIDRLGAGAVASNATIGGHMIGAGNDYTSGVEVYSSQSGHTLIADLVPGTDFSDATYSGFQGGSRATLGNVLLYTGQDPVNGMELWRSDGTAEGTFVLKNISIGASSSTISSIFPSNGFAWFVVRRGDLGSGSGNGVTELWKTDGTSAGTTFVKRCAESDTWNQFYADNSRIVAQTSPIDGSVYSLEILDGPGAGNVIIQTSVSINAVILSGGNIWWQESQGFSFLLKRSDGSTPAVSVPLPAGHALSTLPTAYGDGVICTTTSGSGSHVVWVRTTGSVILRTIGGYAYHASFREHERRLFFIENESLFASDGTADSALLLHTANQIGDSAPEPFTSHQGALYFVSRETSDSPRKIWKTGGTPATTAVTPITLAPGYTSVFLVSNGDWLLYPYEYYDSESGRTVQEVRYTSGSTDGVIIADMTSADLAFHSYQKYLAPFPSGTVFFNRYAVGNGDELYKLELPPGPPTTPFGLWAQSHGLSGTSALPHEDADKDGTPNLVEFYAGTAPDQRSSSVKPVFSMISPSGIPTRIIAFPRKSGTGLTLFVDTSVDMVNWNADVTIAPDGTHTYSPTRRLSIHSREGSLPETMTFSVTSTLAFQKMFVRFRVSE